MAILTSNRNRTKSFAQNLIQMKSDLGLNLKNKGADYLGRKPDTSVLLGLESYQHGRSL